MTISQRELESMYGPLAAFSEHQCGQTITYVRDGLFHTGTIVWIALLGRPTEERRLLPYQYVIEDSYTKWPETIFPSEVIIEKEPFSIL